MRQRNRTYGRGRAGRASSALTTERHPGDNPFNPLGLLVRGVVIATYVSDEAAFGNSGLDDTVAVYCDVLTYSNGPGTQNGMLNRVLVSQPTGGMHTGSIWKPRATQQDLVRGEISADSQAQDLDGDHVLVGFMDGSMINPVILRTVPHPLRGVGNDAAGIGHREVLKLADGDPSVWKHAGAFQGFDKDGNFSIDTTRAHSGEYAADGSEVASDDASHGNVTIRANTNAVFTVEGVNAAGDAANWLMTIQNGEFKARLEDSDTEFKLEDGQLRVSIDGGETLTATGKGASTVVTLGDGLVHAAIVERLQPLYEALSTTLQAWASGHTHPDGFGSTGPSALLLSPPTWDATINSTKLAFPDG